MDDDNIIDNDVKTEADGAEKFALSIKLNDDDFPGEEIEVGVEFTYPKDHGSSAVKALYKLSQPGAIMGLLNALGEMGDPSVQKVIDQHGLGFGSDSDGGYNGELPEDDDDE